MSTPEKYFINQLKSHNCQLPPSDDFEYVRQMKKLKNYFLISENSLQSYLKAKSLSAIYYEKRRQIRTVQVLVVHPLSEFRRGWQLWMCFVLLFAVIIFPFSSAFQGPLYAKFLFLRNKDFVNFYVALVIVFSIRIFCLIDIVVNFMSGYVNPATDEMVIQPSRICSYYLRTYFWVDLISSIPVDFIAVVALGTKAYSQLSIVEHDVFSILPLFKLVRMRTLYDYFYNIFGYFSSSYSVYKMVAATSLYFLIVHWFACLSVLIPRMIYYDDLYLCNFTSCNSSWLKVTGAIEKDNVIQYVTAVHRSLACLIGVGFEVSKLYNIEDKVLAIVIGITGKLYWMLLLVFFLQMIATLRSGKTRYIEMMDQVNHYMSQKKFPPSLRKKIQKYYVYMFQKEFTGEKSILRLLSDNLRQELLLKMHERLIEKVYMFSGLSQSFVFEIISCIKPEIYLDNDVIFKTGDIGTCMYFISYGTVAVFTENGKEVGHLEDGEYFGEVSLILLVRRSATVIALEPTELYRLQIRDFFRIIKPQMNIFTKMEKIAIDRYKKCHDPSSSKDRFNEDHLSKQTEENNDNKDRIPYDDEDDDDEDEEDYDEDEIKEDRAH